MYHVQEIPKDVFAGHEGSAFDSAVVVIAIGIGCFLAFVLITYVLLKKLLPMISRMRSGLMVEAEKEPEVKEEDGNPNPVLQSNERIVVEDD